MSEMHKGSKDTYDNIACWDGGLIPFSTYMKWERMGIVGVLAHYALSFTNGVIVEIGMGESSVYLNELSLRFNRHAYFCDIQGSPFHNALTVPGYFRSDYEFIYGGKEFKLNPEMMCTIYSGSSDLFFKEIPFPTGIAVAFIDGGHAYDQVKNDFENILPHIEDTGLIMMHDTMPPSEDFFNVNSCGTGYKLRQELQAREDLDMFTFIRGAMNYGLTMVRKKPKDLPYYLK